MKKNILALSLASVLSAVAISSSAEETPGNAPESPSVPVPVSRVNSMGGMLIFARDRGNSLDISMEDKDGKSIGRIRGEDLLSREWLRSHSRHAYLPLPLVIESCRMVDSNERDLYLKITGTDNTEELKTTEKKAAEDPRPCLKKEGKEVLLEWHWDSEKQAPVFSCVREEERLSYTLGSLPPLNILITGTGDRDGDGDSLIFRMGDREWKWMDSVSMALHWPYISVLYAGKEYYVDMGYRKIHSLYWLDPSSREPLFQAVDLDPLMGKLYDQLGMKVEQRDVASISGESEDGLEVSAGGWLKGTGKWYDLKAVVSRENGQFVARKKSLEWREDISRE